MTRQQLLAFRKSKNWNLEKAANEIGISTASLRIYEKGERKDRDKPVVIPKPIAWACAAINAGIKLMGG